MVEDVVEVEVSNMDDAFTLIREADSEDAEEGPPNTVAASTPPPPLAPPPPPLAPPPPRVPAVATLSPVAVNVRNALDVDVDVDVVAAVARVPARCLAIAAAIAAVAVVAAPRGGLGIRSGLGCMKRGPRARRPLIVNETV